MSYNVYRVTISGRASISLPRTITNKEITSEFGGGDVNRILTLDLYNNLSLDEGLTVLSSNIRKIDDQTNGLAVKQRGNLTPTRGLFSPEHHINEQNNIQVDISKQVVAAGTTGGVDLNGTVHEVKVYNQWKSIMFSSQLHGGIADPEP